MIANAYELSLGGDENALETDSADRCTTYEYTKKPLMCPFEGRKEQYVNHSSAKLCVCV